MQYKVPQDVQRADTIIGPITWMQLLILMVGGFISYTVYNTLQTNWQITVWLPFTLIPAAITLAFAFLKIHSLPFHEYLMHLIEYNVLPKQRIWIQGTASPFMSSLEEKKEEKKAIANTKPQQTKTIEEITRVLDSGGKSEINQ